MAGKRVAVAMSGGLDSAAVATLLVQRGVDCVGVFMRNWDSSDELGKEACPIDRDREDMHKVCRRLGIKDFEVNFSTEYWNEVFTPFLESYSTGNLTPNPDVLCNKFVKFQHLKRFVKQSLGIDALATGHYARLDHSGSGPRLFKGIDSRKDQSYFLSLTAGDSFKDVLFPLGEYRKRDVREMVRSQLHGLHVLTKPESMGICFIGKRSMTEFLPQYIEMTPGRFVDYEDGRALGNHDGLEAYTTGQRARIGGLPEKYYIVKRPQSVEQSNAGAGSGDLYVVKGDKHPLLYSKLIVVDRPSFNWIQGQAPERLLFNEKSRFEVRYKHSPSTFAALISLPSNESNELVIEFEEPQKAVSPGQIAVLYDGDECLGGGVITKT